MVDSEGYVLIRVGCQHPLADPNGYAREHVLVVMASRLPGAYLLERHPDQYVIHHRNRDRQDNRLENLQVLTREEHNALHNADDRERNEDGRFIGKAAAGRLLDGREWSEMPAAHVLETMNVRRAELIGKKNRNQITDDERAELDRLQRQSLAQVERMCPEPALDWNGLKRLENRLGEVTP